MNKTSLNNYRLRIVGSSEIDSPLQDEKDYSIAFKRLGVRKTEKKPNEDGSYTYTFTLENLDTLTVIGEDKVTFGKNKSASQRLRNRAWLYSEDKGMDSDEFYQKLMNYIINNFEDIAIKL